MFESQEVGETLLLLVNQRFVGHPIPNNQNDKKFSPNNNLNFAIPYQLLPHHLQERMLNVQKENLCVQMNIH